MIILTIIQLVRNTCHYTCQNCITNYPYNCTSCKSSDNRVGPFSQHCYCQTGFYDIFNVSACSTCQDPCLACTGTTNNYCISCLGGNNREISQTSCVCKQSYFNVTSSWICQACHYSCLNCVQSTSNDCVECSANNKRYLVGKQCLCIAGYYQAPITNKTCQKCHYSCLTCTNSDSFDNCTSCDHDVQRWQLNNQCPCITKYYDSNIIQCQQCHYSCRNCSAGSSSNCLNCRDDVHRNYSSNQCTCQPGYYDDGSSPQCRQCFNLCLTCSGPNNNQCNSCHDFRKYQLYLGIPPTQCVCKLGYFYLAITNQCHICHYTCITCSSAGSSNCDTCDAVNNKRSISGAIPNSCVCIDGFFDNLLAVCSTCSSNCKTCDKLQWNCTSCKSSQNRLISNNRCICDNGYFQQGPGTCPKCDINCVTCSVLAVLCLSCNISNFRILNQSSNYCNCNLSYYDNSVPQCDNCDLSCLTCSGPANNQCTSCVTTRQLTVSFTCTCRDTTYQISSNTCGNCDNSCLTCNGSLNSQCLSCYDHHYRGIIVSGVNQYCNCSIGYYSNSGSLICSKCNYKCNTCITSSTNCLSCAINSQRSSIPNCNCNIGYYDDLLTICRKCHFTCLTCQNISTNCLSCTINRTLSQNQCHCKSGTYDNQYNLCMLCSDRCLTCLPNAQSCISCDILKKRIQSGNDCICQPGYYDSNPCQACPWPCATCLSNSQNSCLTCLNNQYVIYSSLRCLCQDGYYRSINTCIICDNTCYTCSGPSSIQCTSCLFPRILRGNFCFSYPICVPPMLIYQHICATTCPQGLYSNGTFCLDCPPQCQSCTQITQCSLCDTGLVLLNGSCLQQCPLGYYEISSICNICTTNCISCGIHNGSIICNECQNGLLLYKYSCSNVCPQGTYASFPSCQKCPVVCLKCNSSTICTACIPKYALVYNKCSQCSVGTFIHLGSCTACQQACISCNNLGCFQCIQGTYLSNSHCVSYGHYWHGQPKECYQNCLKCKGSGMQECIDCIPQAGNLGEPINGTCQCAVGTIPTYQQGCLKSTTLQILTNMGSTGLFASTLCLSGISLITGNSILFERLIIANQNYKPLIIISNQTSMGLTSIIKHYQMYGLNLLPKLNQTQQNQFFFKRLLIQRKGSVSSLKYFMIIIGICWASVLMVFIILACSYWQGSFINQDTYINNIRSSLDWIIGITYRIFYIIVFDGVYTGICYIQSEHNYLAASVLVISLLMTISVIINSCRVGCKPYNPPLGFSFILNDTQKPLLTVKSIFIIQIWLIKRIVLAVLSGILQGIYIGLTMSVLSLLCFIYFYLFNPFRKFDRWLLQGSQILSIIQGLLVIGLYLSARQNKKIIAISMMCISNCLVVLYLVIGILKICQKRQQNQEQKHSQQQELQIYYNQK